ncbi:MAG: fibronectin type III domain-containing protein, partial [Clostridiales bacterium]|nr:fibronectin type III domain-containing protein [Clostridiales bacterium]
LKKSSSKAMTVKWKTNSKATGYQIQYSTSKKFTTKTTKTVTVSKNSKVTQKITKLTKNKTYYVRVRAYKTKSGVKYYSAYSSTKTVKIKK